MQEKCRALQARLMNAHGGYGGPSTGYEGAGVSSGKRVENACGALPAKVPQHGQRNRWRFKGTREVGRFGLLLPAHFDYPR
jgi:hypothetical protein